MMKKKKHELKKNHVESNKCLNPKLIFQTHNLLNLKPKLNQESQFPINLILKDETKKKSF